MMAYDAPCILSDAKHGTTGLSLGPDGLNVRVGELEIRLFIVKIGPNVVDIKLRNIPIRVFSEGESLIKTDI